MLFHTIATGSSKHKITAIHRNMKRIGNFQKRGFFVERGENVQNSAAVRADKVRMGLSIAIKPFLPVYNSHAVDFFISLKLSKVTVYSP